MNSPTVNAPTFGPVGASADEVSRPADIRHYLDALWRRKWLIVVITAVVVAGAMAYVKLQHKSYTASAQVLLQPASVAPLSSQTPSLTPTDVATQIQIVTSAPVQAAVSSELHEAPPPIKASEVGTTNVIQIAATAPTPKRAARIANAYANSYVTTRQQQALATMLSSANVIQGRIDSLQQQLGQLSSGSGHQAEVSALQSQIVALQGQLGQLQVNTQLASGDAQVVTPASASKTTTSPKPVKDGVLAGVLGLLLGCGAALLLETLDDTVRTKDDVEAVVGGLPVLGIVPKLKAANRRTVTTAAEPMSAGAEAFRQLRTSLQFMDLSRLRRLIQVTSASPGEGKTTTAVNLAVALAQSGQRVVLVDADLRRPQVHEYFGFEPTSGLTSVLLGEVSLRESLRPVADTPGLSLLPSGPVPPNPAEVLSSPQMAELLSSLWNSADIVVLDSPPVLPVADASAIAVQADTTLVVVQAGQTGAKGLVRSLEILSQVGAKLTGVVMNAVPINKRRARYGYGGYYGYGSGYAPRTPAALNGAHTNGNGKVPHPSEGAADEPTGQGVMP
ncbi:MAG TPA: polysaccharide biosynthesis tyrosine autokinase [Acidimicrobiales bacterium]|nr:polysaccharide biosynthesis tyrosine autokinase [Acidimicrobiales bacterium]